MVFRKYELILHINLLILRKFKHFHCIIANKKDIDMKIGIVGLGLMGGSLALSLKNFPFVTQIVGFDHNPKHQKEALSLSLVEEIVDFETIKKCDVIILAIPVDAIISITKTLEGIDAKTTIIDFGGTKEKILHAVPSAIRKNFVAAHPMSGTEFFGPSAAIHDLYTDKVVVLCDFKASGEVQQQRALQLFEALRMQITYMSAKEHDRHAAFISHMPHVISYSLANTVIGQENREDILTLAAGGFRSMSRLAKSSPAMWEDIFRQNEENVLEAIELFEAQLCKLKSYIQEGKWQELHQEMQNANTLYDIFS
jgi:prephenate dehydrogenase